MGLVDKAKDATRVATSAAQRGLDQAKDHGQLFTLKRSLGNLNEQLGNTVFRQHEGESGLDSEVMRLVEEIRSVKAEIENLERE